MVKRTYNLPPDVIQNMERTVEPGKRSQLVADLIREWLDRERKQKLRREIIEGCKEMNEVNLELAEVYRSLEEEVDR